MSHPKRNQDHYAFWVADEFHCLWGKQLNEANLDFIRKLDPGYFDYLAKVHARQLDGEDCYMAALALRQHYHQGIELVMTALGAILQAPHVAIAWIPLCHTGALRTLITKLSNREHVCNMLGLELTAFETLAARIFTGEPAHAELHSKLWSRWAGEFLNGDNRNEYNGIKHAHRVQPGGFKIEVHPTDEDGEETDGPLTTVLAGKHGSKFTVPSASVAFPDADRHYSPQLRHHAIEEVKLNWEPGPIAEALDAIAASVHNLRYFMLKELGDSVTDAWRLPKSREYTENPWSSASLSSFKTTAEINITGQRMEVEIYLKRTIKDHCTAHPKNQQASVSARGS